MKADKFIRQVTMTGADDNTDPKSLLGLSATYPFIEFGILISKNNSGIYPRFPSRKWLEELRKTKIYGMRLSMHICGSWVRDICFGNSNINKEWVSGYFDMFDRIQLNTHGVPHHFDYNLFPVMLKYFNKPIIFQMDGVNNNLYNVAKSHDVDCYPLYDLSGGAGLLPEKWDKPIGDYCGYAGGLSPDNLEKQLESISSIVGDKAIWIDAETHLRSNNDKLFDIDKVVRFIRIAKPYVNDK